MKLSAIRFFFLLSLVCFSSFIFGQNTPSGTETAFRASADTLTKTEQKLVELALAGPEARKVEHQQQVYQYQLKSAKNSWMNFLTLSLNYNDQTFNPNIPNVYPKYFFGLNVPIGTFISSKQTKIAREGVAIGELTMEETKRRIRAEVLGKYRQFLSYNQLILLQSELLNDVQAALLQTEDKFRKGDLTFDMYNAAQKNKNEEESRLINLQLEQDLIRLDIERMIGTSLDSVMKF